MNDISFKYKVIYCQNFIFSISFILFFKIIDLFKIFEIKCNFYEKSLDYSIILFDV